MSESDKNFESLRGVTQPDRPGYLNGEIPLRFAKLLSNGDVLVAHQDENGQAIVAIERDGKEIFNFRDLLNDDKRDTAFETPQSLIKSTGSNGYTEESYSMWHGHPGHLMMGDWRSSEGLFFFLHEMGHINNDVQPETDEDGLFRQPMIMPASQFEINNERGANSYAKRQLSELSERLGVDLVSATFPGGEEEMDKFISALEGQFEEGG